MENYYIRESDMQRKYSYDYKRKERRDNINKYNTFVENVQVFYMGEALSYILNKSLGSEPGKSAYVAEMCRTFVKEEGYYKLMRRFKTTTHTLAMIEQCISEACKNTLDGVDKECSLTLTIRDIDQEKFFKDLKKVPLDNITSFINKRVCNAAEEFVQRNINAKLDIEDVAARAKEKIDNAREKLEQKKADEIQQEQMRYYKSETDKIKNRPTRNVYEHMMNLVSNTIMKDSSLRESYTESGSIDMKHIEEQVRIMYTFLEMVNTMKIKKINSAYIDECLKSIK